MTHLLGHDRSQLLLLPEAVDDYVDADNPARFIEAFVERLDFIALGFIGTVPKATGRPGYAPADLLKLYIYGYLKGLSQSFPRTICKEVALYRTCIDTIKGRNAVV